jgi:hypothetical protein
MNQNLHPIENNYDRIIDQTLRRLGSATPAAGIEDRISARLAQEQSREQSKAMGAGRGRFFAVPRFAVLPRFAVGAAVALACVAIVLGSVNHSRRIQPALPGIGPHQDSSGVGAAGAARPANRPVSPSPAEHPRSVRHLPEGRAVISPQSQKPAGVAVPKTPPPTHP